MLHATSNFDEKMMFDFYSANSLSGQHVSITELL